LLVPRGLRVGFVSRFPPVNCGVGEYAHMLSSALLAVKPGLRVYVFSTREAGSEPYQRDGALVVPAYDRLSSDYSGLLEALEEVGGVDVLHLHHEYGIYGDGPEVFEAVAEAERRGLASATVVTLHTVYHPLGLEEGKRRRLDAQRAAARLDAVVVHSVLQEFELYSQGFPPDRVARIPHGTSVNPYTGQNPDQLLEGLGLDPAAAPRPRLVVPGFLRPDKGLYTVLEAARILRARGFRGSLIVAGEEQGRGGAEVGRRLAEAAERGDVVLLHRYLSGDELLRLMAAADVVVLPYEDRPGKYSVSGVLHLGMGTLKPMAGTRVPRLIELYQYAPRLVTAPRSPEKLARLTRWVLENYDYAVAYMSTLYGYTVRTLWPRMARRHLSLYEALLSHRPRA
jgi:glycosyltransferase involved in cell wall biosynthesis